MKTPHVIRSEAHNKLCTDCRVFWAFSNEQFKEGIAKANLAEGEKVVDIGYGGYIPKSEVERFIQGQKEIEKAFKIAMQDHEARIAHITYELYNHEANWSHDIESTLDALGNDFTREEVMAVYKGIRK